MRHVEAFKANLRHSATRLLDMAFVGRRAAGLSRLYLTRTLLDNVGFPVLAPLGQQK